jgi:Ring finger domain
MGRREYVRSLIHGVVRNNAASLTPYDTSLNNTDLINITIKSSDSSNITNNENNDSSGGSKAGPHQLVTTVTAIVGFVLILAMCVGMKSSHTPEAERRIRRYKRGGYKKKPPNYYRLKRIKKSLTVQQVVQVDKSGQVQLRDFRDTEHISKDNDDDAEDISNASSDALGEDVNESSSSVVSEANSENLVACCCICLEPYQEGDIVAWSNSSTEDCLHVFHRDCIHLWLVNPKHNDCPSCRTVILTKASSENDSIESDDDDEDDVESQRRTDSNNRNHAVNDNAHGSINNNNNSTTSVAYYIMHGLISHANQVKFSLIGQTISFDSEDSDFDGLYYTNNTRRHSVDESTRPDWLNQPSTFRRAMSFSDRIFSNTFSSTTRKAQPSTGATWKPVMSTDESNENDPAPMRRASTKVITNLKSLQQAHALRRVVSAGPCTPLDIRKHGLDEQIRFLPTTVGDLAESNMENATPERSTVPFRRTSSLRHRLFSQDTLSDCDEDEKQRIVTDSNFGGVIQSVENTDSTEEDDIIFQKVL